MRIKMDAMWGKSLGIITFKNIWILTDISYIKKTNEEFSEKN